MSLDFILHSTTNLYSCYIMTLVDVLAQILDSSQSSRDLNIKMIIKEKKLRTVRDHILISESGPIAFKNQAIVVMIALSDHPRWMFRKNSMEFFVGLNLSQMVTYYLWWVLWYFKEFKNVKLDKWQKMLLSLRSNPQTMSPYIQNCDSLYTSTDHHMLLPIVLHMVVSLYWK